MNFLDTIEYLRKVMPVVLLIGCATGVYFYKKIDSLHKSLVIYLLLMFGVDILSRVLGARGNNLIVLPIFSFIEMTFFAYLYNTQLFEKKNKFIIVLWVIGVVYILIEFLRYFVFNSLDIKQYQPYAKVVDNFLIIIMALSFFYSKINSFSDTRWGNFKLNTITLIFFTFNTIIFLPFNFLINESSGVKFYFWSGNIILLAIFYIYIISLIWQNSRSNIVVSK